MFAGLAVSMLVYGGIQKAGKRLSPRRQAAQANLVTGFLEYIQGMGVVKAFGLGEMSGKAVNQAIGESADANIILESVFSSLTGVYQTIFKLAKSAILVVAPYLMLGGEITPVKCLLLLVSSFMIYSSVELVGSMASVARVIDASLDRMEAVMDTPVLDEHGGDIPLDHYDIELAHVSFAYGQENVLQDVSAIIPEKTTCAIVGPSGSGKTTLVSLIARFWDVNDGKITIGGVDIRSMPLAQLADIVSFVTQDNFLFNCSIKENIRLGNPDATDEEVYAAAKAACCDEFIQKLDNGYDTMAGDAGNRLSGGEKQRISIARMILKNAPIVILDEATAFTDQENEEKIQQSIAALTKGKTLLVIAHRLSTIKNADQIIVLQNGQVENAGTHQQLLDGDALYRDMWEAHIGAQNWSAGSGKGGN